MFKKTRTKPSPRFRSTITAAACLSGCLLWSPAVGVAAEPAECGTSPEAARHHHLPANNETVHWGYFSKSLAPRLVVHSGDVVTVETLMHHAGDDLERMVKGDPGAESVFFWDSEKKGVNRRGAGPMDASVYGRGAGEGFVIQPVAVVSNERLLVSSIRAPNSDRL